MYYVYVQYTVYSSITCTLYMYIIHVNYTIHHTCTLYMHIIRFIHVLYTCTSYVYIIHVNYTCKLHITHVHSTCNVNGTLHHTCTLYMHIISVHYTCASQMYITHVHHTCTLHMYMFAWSKNMKYGSKTEKIDDFISIIMLNGGFVMLMRRPSLYCPWLDRLLLLVSAA